VLRICTESAEGKHDPDHLESLSSPAGTGKQVSGSTDPTVSSQLTPSHGERPNKPDLATTLRTIPALLSKVLNYFRKMVKRVTYSRKRCVKDDVELAQNHDSSSSSSSSKRHRTNATDEIRSPPSLSKETHEMTTSASNRDLRSPDSPTSVSDVGTDALTLIGSAKTSVFDRDLKKQQPTDTKQSNIYGSREEFVETTKDRKRWKQHSASPRNTQLPTPPAEAQKSIKDDQDTNGSTMKHAAKSKVPIEISRPSERSVKNGHPTKAYQPKSYTSKQTSAPSRNVLGKYLSQESQEVQK